ncbi:MAG: M20/M25/M40 family metallo-hydrolase [Dyella sp.]|uniref:M20/M25/M40 family metallo-hydrolase n=1 Tax=Dyella sp. TaxID=1869338 RepID=UPI003F7F87E4
MLLSRGKVAGAGAWTLVAVLAVLVVIATVARRELEPLPLTATTKLAGFSAVRAKQALSTVLGGGESPHPVDSPADDAVRNRIIEALRGMGYRPEIQDVTSCRKAWLQVCARVRNIIAVRDGLPGGKPILLASHYDSVAAGPGASDDGAGVAVSLEVARLLQRRSSGAHSVIFLFTEGEEEGLLGAEAFAENDPRAKDLALVINLEARGTSGKSAMFETGDDSGWLVDRYASTARSPLTSSLLDAVYKLMPNDTDFSVFKARGVQGLNFAFGENYGYYHTSDDNLNSLNDATLQHQGNNVYALVQSLLDAPLPAPLAKGARVYTDVLGAGVISWPQSWSLWLALLLLLVFVATSWAWRRHNHYDFVSVRRGAAGLVLSMAMGASVGYVLLLTLGMTGDHGVSWHSDVLFNRWLLWSMVLLVVLLVQRWLGRGVNPVGVWIGLTGAWLMLGLLCAIFAPAICYLFVLPGAVSIVVMAALLPAKKIAMRSAVLFLLSAIAVFAMIFPVVYLIEIMLGFNVMIGSAGMGMLLGLAFSYVMPLAVQEMKSPVHRCTGYAVALAAFACIVLSLKAPAHSEAVPKDLNIAYFQSAGNAMLLVGNATNPPPAAVLQAVGKRVTLKSVLPWTSSAIYVAPTETLALTPARLTPLGEIDNEKGRQVGVRIDAGGPLRAVWVLAPPQANLQSISMDGHTLSYMKDDSKMGSYRAFICYGQSCDGKQLAMVLGSKTAASILVVKAAALPGAFADITRARNGYALPVNEGDQSLIVSEVKL